MYSDAEGEKGGSRSPSPERRGLQRFSPFGGGLGCTVSPRSSLDRYIKDRVGRES